MDRKENHVNSDSKFLKPIKDKELPSKTPSIEYGGLRTKNVFKESHDNKPLITIITVVYNGEEYLEETINSVINQDYENVEYIVIDGGSTDKSLQIIKKKR